MHRALETRCPTVIVSSSSHALSTPRSYPVKRSEVRPCLLPWLCACVRNPIRGPPTPIQVRVLIGAIPSLLAVRVRHGRCRLHVCLFVLVVCRTDDRDEIYGKTPHVEREYQRDGPFDYCSRIVALSVTEHTKRDAKGELDDDEHQLDIEGDS